jgi:hypothetical protein
MSVPEELLANGYVNVTPEIKQKLYMPIVHDALKTIIETTKSVRAHIMSAIQRGDYDHLLSLMAFQKAVDTYVSAIEQGQEEVTVGGMVVSNQEFEKLATTLLDEQENQEFFQDMKSIGFLLMAGISCAVGPGKFFRMPGVRRLLAPLSRGALGRTSATVGFLTCALGTGIVANHYFYGIASGRYQAEYERVFSTSGNHHFFQEVSALKPREIDLILESIFFFIGTGLPEAARKLSMGSQVFLKKVIRSGP